MFRPIPLHVTRRRGFSLVLSLTVMAMLLLLCISIAALMSVEMRVARAAVSQSRARLNAMVGARIALGELQRLAGPDQRVTATADILCSADDGVLPTSASYYRNTATGATITHPRWVGVWNSGRQSGVNAGNVADASTVLSRHADGYMVDTRFVSGADWAKDRLTTPRMQGWLVSGNEGLSPLASKSDFFTPETPLMQADSANRRADFTLLGTGVFDGNVAAYVNTSASDMLGLRVRRVNIPDSANEPTGAFAYAVLDEGVKGRINLPNKYAGKQPAAGAYTDGGYYNLVLPQRQIFDTVKSPFGIGASNLENHSRWDAERVARLTGFDDIGLAITGMSMDTAAEVRRQFYHDITFHSAGVLADVVEGGLRKDLTAFLNRGDIADAAGVEGSGLVGERRLISGLVDVNSAKVTTNQLNFKSIDYDPPLALIANWYKAGAATGGGVAVSPPGLIAGGRIEGTDSRVPAYTATASAMVSPVLTAYNFSYKLSLLSAADQKVRYLKYIYFTVWNPYSVPITANNLTLTVNSRLEANCNLYNGGIIYSSPRRAMDYRIPGAVTLAPGQAITYIPAPNQDLSVVPMVGAGNIPAGGTVTVNMVKGVPDVNAYFLDRAYNYAGSDQANGALTQQGRYFWTLINGPHGKDYTAQDPCDHYFLRASGTGGMMTLQEVNLDSMAPLGGNGYEYILCNTGVVDATPPLLDDAKLTLPHPRLRHGFRLMALDEPFMNSDGINQNTSHNMFVNANVRAAVHCRHPFDRAQIVRRDFYVARGLYTTDPSLNLDDPQVPTDAANTQPFLRQGGAATRFAILDMPRPALGLHSLGQLQHAPLVNVPWASTLPVGNSLLPVQPILPDRSALPTSSTDSLWSGFNRVPFKNHYAPVNQTPGQAAFLDWSYELNNALWDEYHFSGIPSGNVGWTRREWDLGIGVDAAKNSRYEPVAPMPAGGYFAEANFDAYRAAYTLLQKGAFNVNSTSVVAWKSLLSAFRHVSVPSSAGGATAGGTPFTRHLSPVAGAYSGGGDAAGGLTNPAVWSGYRSLSDDELQTLAEKIVAEVKSRGPFLSMADFVNRRLKPVSDQQDSGGISSSIYENWLRKERENDVSIKENKYLGALQSAIEEAQLNKSLVADSGTVIDVNRTKPDVISTDITAGQINPSHKAKSKLAGTPGYLLQSDVLQQIGSALSARSDTFTVRAAGLAEDGTRAYVELVVQRIPEPLIPANKGEGVPVNPKAIAVRGSVAEGTQFMGRRFVVVSTKWIKEDQI